MVAVYVCLALDLFSVFRKCYFEVIKRVYTATQDNKARDFCPFYSMPLRVPSLRNHVSGENISVQSEPSFVRGLFVLILGQASYSKPMVSIVRDDSAQLRFPDE